MRRSSYAAFRRFVIFFTNRRNFGRRNMNPDRSHDQCQLCGTPSAHSFSMNGRDFYHCGSCDLVFVPASQHISIDEARGRYLKHRNTPDNAGYMARFRSIIAIMRELAPGAHRVLDFGSGPAPVFVDLLNDEGYEAVGY